MALRRVYASALPAYIDRCERLIFNSSRGLRFNSFGSSRRVCSCVRMGVAVCRHLRRLERVVLGYLEVRDPPGEASRLKILETLQKTIRAAWPR